MGDLEQEVVKKLAPTPSSVLTPDDTKTCDEPSGHNDSGIKMTPPSHPACNCTDADFRALEKKVRNTSNAMLCKWDAYGRIDCFRGLCLDCVLNTGGEDTDELYWEHMGNGVFDAGFGEGKACAVKHGQPDWYYSLMGRAEILRKYRDLDDSRLGEILRSGRA